MIHFHICPCTDHKGLLVPLVNTRYDKYTGAGERYVHMFVCLDCEKLMRRSRIPHELDKEGEYLWEHYRTSTCFVWNNPAVILEGVAFTTTWRAVSVVGTDFILIANGLDGFLNRKVRIKVEAID